MASRYTRRKRNLKPTAMSSFGMFIFGDDLSYYCSQCIVSAAHRLIYMLDTYQGMLQCYTTLRFVYRLEVREGSNPLRSIIILLVGNSFEDNEIFRTSRF